jgi:hypothetical protein
MGLENQETVPDEQSEESFEGKMSKSRPDTAKGKKADKVQSSATRSTTADNTGQATRKRKAQRRVSFSPEETRHNGKLILSDRVYRSKLTRAQKQVRGPRGRGEKGCH